MAYELDGVEYPSVTQITGQLDKPALLVWAAGCAVDYIKDNIDLVRDPFSNVHQIEEVLESARSAHIKKKKDAATAGTLVHNAIDDYVNGRAYSLHHRDPDIRDKVERGFEAFLKWESFNHLEWLFTEVAVVSKRVGYAGRFDAIARINGIIHLIDFKTSKGVYDEFRWQLCAYRQAWNESEAVKKGITIDNLMILHLDKESGDCTPYYVTSNIERMTRLFNYLVAVYYYSADRKLKNNPFVKMARGESVTPF